MKRSSITFHKTTKIVYDDFSNLKNREEVKAALDYSMQFLQQFEPKSVYCVINVENCYYDKEVLTYLQEVTNETDEKYMAAQAIIGLSPLQSFIFKGVQMFAKRPFYVAKNLEDAKEWLHNKFMENEAKKILER